MFVTDWIDPTRAIKGLPFKGFDHSRVRASHGLSLVTDGAWARALEGPEAWTVSVAVAGSRRNLGQWPDGIWASDSGGEALRAWKIRRSVARAIQNRYRSQTNFIESISTRVRTDRNSDGIRDRVRPMAQRTTGTAVLSIVGVNWN